MSDKLWDARERLRDKGLLPDWSHVGVPWIMTGAISYFVVVIDLPTLLFSGATWALSGHWWIGLLSVPVWVVVVFLLQFFLLQG